MAKGTLLYAQSGGVTAVINASAAAVISQARASKIKVLAARNGILGALREDLIDTSKESAAAIRALAHTPGGAFGARGGELGAPVIGRCRRCRAGAQRPKVAGQDRAGARGRAVGHTRRG